MSAEQAQREPTMEEILASIRRIISEEDRPSDDGVKVLDLQPPTPPAVEVKAPPMLSKVSSWADYWEKYQRLATSAVDKARRQAAGENVGRFSPLPYASLVVS